MDKCHPEFCTKGSQVRGTARACMLCYPLTAEECASQGICISLHRQRHFPACNMMGLASLESVDVPWQG